MNKEEAAKRIADLTNQAMDLIKQAEKIANEFGVDFSFDVAYGMGGTYYPEGHKWAKSVGWQASSHSC